MMHQDFHEYGKHCNKTAKKGQLKQMPTPERRKNTLYIIASVIHIITKYGSTLYIGMDEVLAHYVCTLEKSNLHFHFQ